MAIFLVSVVQHIGFEATMDDRYDLQRFVDAQDEVYDRVRAELAAGAKRSHWMWFVFPQLQALGRSSTARLYGIASLDEAQAYAKHPVLGPRLVECARLMLGVSGKTALQILGSPDDLKLRSCMTLFARAMPEERVFGEVIEKYYGGEPDRLTQELLP